MFTGKSYVYIIILMILLGLIIGCAKNTENITLAGSTAFQPFAEKLAEEYMKKNPDVNINVQGGGSGMGIQSAISGTANIGMADLVKLPPETNELNKFVVAKDSIVVIVNSKNTIENLTIEQIQKIFSGEITNWKDIGGEDKSINVISREEGSGTRSSFENILMPGIKLSPRILIQDSNGTVRENVSSDMQAIGYISHGLINEKVKAIGINGISPTIENMKNGSYILIRPIYLLTKGETKGLAKNYIDFVLSNQGQEIIQSSGLIPVK